MINKLIAIELLWALFYYLCYPSILIWSFKLWIIPNTLDLPSKAFVIWCSISYTRYILSMLHILHQIYTFVNSRLGSSQPNPHASNYIKTKPSRHIPVKPGRDWPTRFWLLSSSHYPGYPIKKLISITKKRGRLRLTGFSTLPSTMVLKGGKPHTSSSGRSADRLNNLSCIRISKWEYIFQVIYAL